MAYMDGNQRDAIQRVELSALGAMASLTAWWLTMEINNRQETYPRMCVRW